MKNITITIALCIAAILQAGAQNAASNTRVQAQSNLMIVYYDLAAKSDVEAYVSFDNGVIWQGPIQHSSGSTGNGVEPGRDKIIIWHSIDEIGSVEKDATIRVIATRVGASGSPDIAAFVERVTPGVTTTPVAPTREEPPPVVATPPPAVVTPAVVTQPPPSTAPSGSGRWVVIIGSFPTRAGAESYIRQIQGEGLNCEIIDAGSQRFRVSAGRFNSMDQANNLANELKPARQGQVWVTTDDR